MTILLNDVDEDTVGEIIQFNGGPGVLFVRGDDFGGGQVIVEAATVEDKLQRFSTLPNATFTSDTTKTLDYLTHSIEVRASLVGATNPVNVFVCISQ